MESQKFFRINFSALYNHSSAVALHKRNDITVGFVKVNEVGFHDAFDSADFFDAFVDFGYVHSADDGYDVVFTCDFVDGFYIGVVWFLLLTSCWAWG